MTPRGVCFWLHNVLRESRHYVSLLLQIICIEYTKPFRKLTSYSNGGETTSIQDKICHGFSHVATSSLEKIFSCLKVMNNTYCLLLEIELILMLNTWPRAAIGKYVCITLSERDLPCAMKAMRQRWIS